MRLPPGTFSKPTEEMIESAPAQVQALLKEFPPFSTVHHPNGSKWYVVGYGVKDNGHESLIVIDRDPETVTQETITEVDCFEVCAHHFRPGGSDDCTITRH